MRPATGLANKLYYGDNLGILRDFPDECVDLIYLDPPWNSKIDYNAIFRDEFGRRSEAQREAFADTWHWGPVAEDHYSYLTHTARHAGAVPSPVGTLVAAFRAASGTTPMLAYVVHLTIRLVEMHRVLKPTGSLYLHSDPTASHYLKLVLDSIFGPTRFLAEIIWKRTSAHSSAKRPAPVHDTILLYSKTAGYTWNAQYMAHDPEYIRTHYTQTDDAGRRWMADNLTAAGVRQGSSGQPWRGFDVAAKGNHWKFSRDNLERLDREGRIYWPKRGGWPRYRRYLDEMKGVPLKDIWTDIAPVNARARERIGWPTQKPVALLERIIRSSSNPGDVVLDAYCGCGTALDAAESVGATDPAQRREWIGIDHTWYAIAIMKARLRDRFGIEAQVEGAPTEVEGARQLSVQRPNGREQFEAWALSLIGAVPHGGPQRKGADKGADGVVTFSARNGVLASAIVSVKSGHVQAAHVQQLRGAMARHDGVMGLFITLEEPTKPMLQEAASAGLYHSDLTGLDYPRVQILTVRELLDEGRRPELPPLLVEFRGTLWTDEEVPHVPRPRKVRRAKGASSGQTTRTAPKGKPTESPVAVQLRDDYARRRESEREMAEERGRIETPEREPSR